tara:strand:- start:313 stop:474 length:162 start_codon:yes stop_codon:yes gene_type:complete
MKYEVWVYLESEGFWWKHMTTSNKQQAETKKQKLITQGHKVKQSINYIGVDNV